MLCVNNYTAWINQNRIANAIQRPYNRRGSIQRVPCVVFASEPQALARLTPTLGGGETTQRSLYIRWTQAEPMEESCPGYLTAGRYVRSKLNDQ